MQPQAAGNPAMQPSQPEVQDPQERQRSQLDKMLEQINIAEKLDEEKLDEIGSAVYSGYELDRDSKKDWDRCVDEWVKLAAQVREVKNYPWPKASNIKYPILSTAAMQFAARAYPSLVPADGKMVQFRVVGQDPSGAKAATADKLAKHMNYQLLEDMPDWEEDMDKLLIQLPIIGCLFKKTYFDQIKKANVSKLVGPRDLVVNYWASTLEGAHRKTEIIPMTKNEVQAYKNAGIFLDVDLGDPKSQPALANKAEVLGQKPPSKLDDSTPYVILEQHTFWDLDDDGYQEPYIITIEEGSKKVLRIVARFDSDGIVTGKDGKLICIQPVEYYTKYGFIPNPDGGFYDIGFGHLLGPINESANTLINQLVDAGSLSNLQSGFIGKGLRLKIGTVKLTPGTWIDVNATGDDLRKQIFPMPVQQPSDVLFKLLGMLVESSEKLASIAEIFTGKMPGQNTPATTTQATIEQGMKVFTAIYKRTYRSLTKEFKKIFRLNSLYEENFEKAQAVLDEAISPADYDRKKYDVCPTADPTAVSSTQKQMKVQMLGELIPLGTINIMEFTKRALEAQEQPNLEALMQQPQPQVDPKVQAVQAKMQMDKEKHKMDMVMKKMDLQFKQMEAMMNQKFMEQEKQMEMKLREMEFGQKAQHQIRQAKIDEMTGRQEMAFGQEQHSQKMTQMKEQANAKRESRAMDGMERSSSNAGSKGSNAGKDRGR